MNAGAPTLVTSGAKGFVICSLLLAGATVVTHGVPEVAVEQSAGPSKLYVTPAASSLIEQGLAAAAPAGSDAASFQEIPSPGVRYLPNVARATNVPWIDSNGWRFARGMRKVSYANVPAGSASLAAAEAFVFNVDAIINPDPKDLEDLGKMLRFLKSNEQAPLPDMVNIGEVDSPSPLLDEVLNLLTRRNLLYKVVPAPDRTLDLNVQLGTPDFPAEAAANPYEFAARVRAKLGDDKRLVRLYGTDRVIARLTGDRSRARLYLLSFGSRRQQNAGARAGAPSGRVVGAGVEAIRVRVQGRYQPAKFAAYGGNPEAKVSDVRHPGTTTEFWVPDFDTCAIIDLEGMK
jgi:hypothetical protein